MALPDSMPSPRTPDPMEAPALRWGVLGPGWIAERFVEALQTHTRQEVAAVGSRDLTRSQEFADRFGIATATGSYADLIALDDVDIVYVATPHQAHADLAVAAMEAGKHVLVEKPIATHGADARRVAEVAERTGRYCCEALWSVFLPKWDVIRQLLEDGALGRIRSISGEYGEHFTGDHRIFDPALAGGPLLDLGIYPLSMITSIAGAPTSIVAHGTAHPTGVTGQLAVVMTHDDDVLSTFLTTMYGALRNELRIVGDDATLTVEPVHNGPGPLTLTSADGSRTVTHDEPFALHVDGLHFQAVEAARRVAAGERQSPMRPLSQSVVALEAVDAIAARLPIGTTA